ncbi:MAG: HD domain-containing protein, partial [Bacilli bacterium]|nr:HD domain-containing protein [Bacilli bacterium]
MFKKLSYLQLNIVLASIIFGATFLGYVFTSDIHIGSYFWLSSGFVVGYYTFFDKKAIIGLFIGILLANLLARFIFIEESIILTMFFSLFFSIVQLFEAFLFKRLMTFTNSFGFIKFSNTFYYLGIALFISIFSAFLGSTILLFSMDFSFYFQTLIRWAVSDFIGIVIYGTIILYVFYYDDKFVVSRRSTLNTIVFLLVFSFISIALFSNTIPWFQYRDFNFIFIVFFLIMAFFFSYRMILICDAIFLIIFYFFLRLSIPDYNIDLAVWYTYLYLLILSSSGAVIKMMMFEIKYKNISLEDANTRLGNLINSTNSLLQLSDDLLDSNVKIHEDYIKRIFKIATSIFDGFDYATCYLKGDPYIHFIDTVGYDIDDLNSFNFLATEFHIDTVSPVYVNSASKTVKESLPNNYTKFIKTNPIISESIRFGIFIEQGLIGGMSFDITESSGKRFNQFHYESYKSFQKLMNSFFAMNYLNYKNQNLKNDIVLSLIRTLELYDQYTGGHSEEVAYLSGEIAKRIFLKDKEIYDIYWAGVVHDIGKVGIKSDIINKPEKLSLEEYELVKEHPIFGFEILNKSEDLANISLLVRHHHEWWNGAGYPDGLRGEEIPIGAQIIAICDAVSTMATKRPYTVVRTSTQILKELELYRGIQFAPIPTDAMIEFIK